MELKATGKWSYKGKCQSRIYKKNNSIELTAIIKQNILWPMCRFLVKLTYNLYWIWSLILFFHFYFFYHITHAASRKRCEKLVRLKYAWVGHILTTRSSFTNISLMINMDFPSMHCLYIKGCPATLLPFTVKKIWNSTVLVIKKMYWTAS